MESKEKLIALSQYLPHELELYGASDIWTMHSLGIEEICIANGLHIQTLSFDDCLLDYSPILRPLSSMTEEEKKEMKERFDVKKLYVIDVDGHLFVCEDLGTRTVPIPEECRQWLLSKHFDLFGLIEKGFAVDKG